MQKTLLQHLANFGLAVSFSSRIPIPHLERAEIGKAFAWLPLAGAVLALFALLPVFLPVGNTWLLAWLYVAIMAWLTRGLHWDGLADVADGLASNKNGASFWKVVKDSKLGALGALCIIIVAAGYIISIQSLLETAACVKVCFALPWAAGLGRTFALLLPSLAQVNPKAGLGQSMQEAEPFFAAVTWLGLLTLSGIFFLGFLTAILALGSGLLLTWRLAGKAEQMGGFNGDFLGAAIALAELAALTAAALTA